MRRNTVYALACGLAFVLLSVGVRLAAAPALKPESDVLYGILCMEEHSGPSMKVPDGERQDSTLKYWLVFPSKEHEQEAAKLAGDSVKVEGRLMPSGTWRYLVVDKVGKVE